MGTLCPPDRKDPTEGLQAGEGGALQGHAREWGPAHECGRVLGGHRRGALEVTGEKVKDTGTDASGTAGGSSL